MEASGVNKKTNRMNAAKVNIDNIVESVHRQYGKTKPINEKAHLVLHKLLKDFDTQKQKDPQGFLRKCKLISMKLLKLQQKDAGDESCSSLPQSISEEKCMRSEKVNYISANKIDKQITYSGQNFKVENNNADGEVPVLQCEQLMAEVKSEQVPGSAGNRRKAFENIAYQRITDQSTIKNAHHFDGMHEIIGESNLIGPRYAVTTTMNPSSIQNSECENSSSTSQLNSPIEVDELVENHEDEEEDISSAANNTGASYSKVVRLKPSTTSQQQFQASLDKLFYEVIRIRKNSEATREEDRRNREEDRRNREEDRRYREEDKRYREEIREENRKFHHDLINAIREEKELLEKYFKK